MSESTMQRMYRVAVPLAVGGLAFQVAHFLEHMLQAGYWIIHPTAPPWLTPWAAEGRDILANGGNPGTGTELLHLLGNGLFFAGLFAMCVVVACRAKRLADNRALSWAMGVQGFHLAEHVLLTVSFIAGGEALGFSTMFGALDAGTALSTYRVWFHFLINLAATWLAVAAYLQMSRERLFAGPVPATA